MASGLSPADASLTIRTAFGASFPHWKRFQRTPVLGAAVAELLAEPQLLAEPELLAEVEVLPVERELPVALMGQKDLVRV